MDKWLGVGRSDGAAVDAEVTLRLCGVDCEPRYLAGASVESLLLQATTNLQLSFAHVGVLEHFDKFVRGVQRLSPHLHGFAELHAHGRMLSQTQNENACKAHWGQPGHQSDGLQKSQVLRQLRHLYDVALARARVEAPSH